MAAPKGNNYGAKGKEWQLALRRAMAHEAEGDWRATLQRIAAVVVKRAMEGDRDAWQEIANREDGRPSQTVDLNVTRTIADISDGELAALIKGGSGAGTPAAQSRETVAAGLH